MRSLFPTHTVQMCLYKTVQRFGSFFDSRSRLKYKIIPSSTVISLNEWSPANAVQPARNMNDATIEEPLQLQPLLFSVFMRS